MACTITEGFNKGCRNSTAGLYQFYMATYPIVLNITNDGTDGEITAIDDGATIPVNIDYFPFVPNKNSSEFLEKDQISLPNGQTGYEQTATMIFSKMEAAKANTIKMLATGNLTIIIKDRNENYFLMGEKNGAELNSGSTGSGKSLSDLNGYNLEFIAFEGDPITQIEATSIDVDAVTGNLTVHI